MGGSQAEAIEETRTLELLGTEDDEQKDCGSDEGAHEEPDAERKRRAHLLCSSLPH